MVNKDTGTILGMPSAAFGQLVMQVVAVIGLILFAILKDGVPTGEILNTLEAIAIGTGVGATAMGMVHVWRTSVPQPQQTAQSGQGVQNTADVPPGGVSAS